MAKELSICSGSSSDTLMLKQSYKECRRVVKASSSNFYYGMWLTLDKQKRNSLFAIYAWMRVIDDIADSKVDAVERTRELNKFYQITKNVLQAPTLEVCYKLDHDNHFWPALWHTVNKYKIPHIYFHEMFLGQQQSIEQHRYTTFSELYRYCYLVASTVGLICIYIWGYNGTEDTRKMAEYRGIALQLINVVRDVYTDVVEGNFFIPIELVKNNATMHQQIIAGDHQEIIKAIENIIAKAEDYYQKSYGLERHVSRSGSLSMRVMSKTYFCLLKEIKKNPSLIFSDEKIKLTGWKKFMVCVISIVQWCVIG